MSLALSQRTEHHAVMTPPMFRRATDPTLLKIPKQFVGPHVSLKAQTSHNILLEPYTLSGSSEVVPDLFICLWIVFFWAYKFHVLRNNRTMGPLQLPPPLYPAKFELISLISSFILHPYVSFSRFPFSLLLLLLFSLYSSVKEMYTRLHGHIDFFTCNLLICQPYLCLSYSFCFCFCVSLLNLPSFSFSFLFTVISIFLFPSLLLSFCYPSLHQQIQTLRQVRRRRPITLHRSPLAYLCAPSCGPRILHV